MILELKYDTSRTPEAVVNGSRVTVFYSDFSDIERLLPAVRDKYNEQLSTLVIWGTHGSATSLCNLSTNDIANLVRMLAGITFRTIVLDACESALHAHRFNSVLKNNGAVLCHIGICGAQILNGQGSINENEIRTAWRNTITETINLFNQSPEAIRSFFPAIYRESSGMHHLMLRGMLFENGGTDPFVEKDLNRNVDATNSKAIGSAEEFLNLLQ
jgi:hypothetical protein